MRRLMSRLIWIYAVWHSVFQLYILTSFQSTICLKTQTINIVWNLAPKELTLLSNTADKTQQENPTIRYSYKISTCKMVIYYTVKRALRFYGNELPVSIPWFYDRPYNFCRNYLLGEGKGGWPYYTWVAHNTSLACLHVPYFVPTLDWFQSPVTEYFTIIRFDNPLIIE